MRRTCCRTSSCAPTARCGPTTRAVNVRAWLYRVAHNRCIDHLRRPVPAGRPSLRAVAQAAARPDRGGPAARGPRPAGEDVGRLPEQQRSALLMREIDGMSYVDLAGALDVTVPAVKSLLVRARLGLVDAADARDADCSEIRPTSMDTHDRGVKASARARRHMRGCDGCTEYRAALRGIRRSFAALSPAGAGPLALVGAKLLGLGGAGGGAAAGGSAAAAGGGGVVTFGGVATATHARSPLSSVLRRSRRAAPSRSASSRASTAPRPRRRRRRAPRVPRRRRPSRLCSTARRCSRRSRARRRSPRRERPKRSRPVEKAPATVARRHRARRHRARRRRRDDGCGRHRHRPGPAARRRPTHPCSRPPAAPARHRTPGRGSCHRPAARRRGERAGRRSGAGRSGLRTPPTEH